LGKGYRVGDSIKILGHPFRISGIVEPGKGGRKLIPLTTMGELMGSEGKASLFYVKCDKPADEDEVVREIRATPGFENNEVMTIDGWLDQMTPDRIPGFNIALDVVTGIAVIVGFLVIFQSMYTAVLERTREIGILKSMGASKLVIVSVVVRECAVLAAAGVILGIVGTFGVRELIFHLWPTQHFEITSNWIANGAMIAFVGSLCGSFYPAWMAARKDPIDALAYE
jgi:putative ABC transport system permease protein